jgi:hypothetical protein
METSGQLHASAVAPPGKQPTGTHCIGGWVGLRAGEDAVDYKKSHSLAGKRTPAVQLVDHRSID